MLDARRARHANALYGQKMRGIGEQQNPSHGSGGWVPADDNWGFSDDNTWDSDNNDDWEPPCKLSSGQGANFPTGADFSFSTGADHPGGLEEDPRTYRHLLSGRPEIDGVREDFYCRQMEEDLPAGDVYSDDEDARYWPASSDDERGNIVVVLK